MSEEKKRGTPCVYGVPGDIAIQTVDAGGLPYDYIFQKDRVALARVRQNPGQKPARVALHPILVRDHGEENPGSWYLGPAQEERTLDDLETVDMIFDRLVRSGHTVHLTFGPSSETDGPFEIGDPFVSVTVVGPNLKQSPVRFVKEIDEAAELAQEAAASIAGPVNPEEKN